MERQGRCWYNRQNNGGVYDARKGIYRRPVGTGYKHGAPDILVCIGGRYVGLEVKSGVGVLSEHQKAFKQGLERTGGTYVVARSVEDVVALFTSQ